ncbi:MAG TPA: phosphate ABC transporter permease PstA [Egibacteraceae bacterium]|nr:phosphate ABC transporter permease PstA [Actinomycetota bacterium]HWB71968.1 phosphate ABC transporter permease PstA [Egibacteraceae bacterium]
MALSTPQKATRAAVVRLQRGSGRDVKERAFAGLLLAATAVGVIVLAVLLVDILVDGLGRLNWQFLTAYASRFPERTGVRSGITGSLSLMVLVALMSIPLGVGAALYLEEFAPDNRFTRLMEANIANLAGVPSVVYGLLGVAVFVYLFEFGRSLLAGAATLTLLILPVIIVAGRESLRAVPPAIRDAGLALGATPWQVTSRQVLPAALPGILTGTILALSRAIGETAPLLVIGALFSRRSDNEPWNLLESFTALPVQIFNFVSRPQEAFKVEAAGAAIIVLMVALLAMNSVAIVLRNRFARRW